MKKAKQAATKKQKGRVSNTTIRRKVVSTVAAPPTVLLTDIRHLIQEARQSVAAAMNVGLTLLLAYWPTHTYGSAARTAC